LSVMIKHLINHLKRSGMRGPKYGDLTRSNYSETPLKLEQLNGFETIGTNPNSVEPF
jgi:hypothetical protein